MLAIAVCSRDLRHSSWSLTPSPALLPPHLPRLLPCCVSGAGGNEFGLGTLERIGGARSGLGFRRREIRARIPAPSLRRLQQGCEGWCRPAGLGSIRRQQRKHEMIPSSGQGDVEEAPLLGLGLRF